MQLQPCPGSAGQACPAPASPIPESSLAPPNPARKTQEQCTSPHPCAKCGHSVRFGRIGVCEAGFTAQIVTWSESSADAEHGRLPIPSGSSGKTQHAFHARTGEARTESHRMLAPGQEICASMLKALHAGLQRIAPPGPCSTRSVVYRIIPRYPSQQLRKQLYLGNFLAPSPSASSSI